ncbi:MAG: hypothetical protein M3428_05985 [Pseudomonadota bacterium]|jgi:hypothetical protein|nr:hypothetical protein [Sphingomonas sp.]MDQ3471909.1 hypothetical protein [Pseudomonadota bacterium]
MSARPRLNRSGCLIVVLVVIVVIGLLIWIDRERQPKPMVDAVTPMEGPPSADAARP